MKISDGTKYYQNLLLILTKPYCLYIPIVFSNIINCVPKNTKTNNTTYVREDLFVYEGSNISGELKKIVAFGYKDSGVTNFSIKIYDKTNNLIIAENTFTDSSENFLDITPLSNIPTTRSLIEILIKKTGGTISDYAHIENISLYFI